MLLNKKNMNKNIKESILEKILKLKLENPFVNKLEIQRLQQSIDNQTENNGTIGKEKN